ncbi:amino acid permease [Enterococcus faecium]|uniref:APC family permease n=1 Tax=Enterococcus faecium TaxID=1352 RepID=UPI00288D85DE|nr:amino acid permease [Enterococcus faecium]MDT2362590.1 amino acid permease [Enterococcus faecium]
MEEYQATPVKEVKIENELKRTMGFFTALSTVMGTVIGAGVFFKAASVAKVTGSASLHMFSWFLGGMISVCAGLTGAELAAAISILLINFLGSKAGGAFQSITLVCKLIPLFVIVIFGLFRQEGVDFQLFPIQAGENLSFFSALGAGLLATMFAYDGWIHVGNISGELKKPAKDLPKAISLGIIGIMIVYLLVNAVFLRTASIDGVAGNSNAASDVAKMIFGGFGGRLVTVGILISVYGTINGYTLTGMRLPYVMAKENNLPFSKLFAKLHDKTKVPVAAGILELVIAIGMMMIGGFDTLTDMLIFVIWIFYTMVFVGVILLRKKEPDLFRPYKVPMYPFIPLVAIIGGTFIVSSTLITQTFLASMGIVLTLAGIPIYLYLKRR